MKYFAHNNYQEYHFSIGDADFTFFSNVNTVSDRQNAGVTMHAHKFYELFHVLRGNITIFTEEGDLHLEEEDMVILAPEVTHTTKIFPSSLRFSLTFSIEQNQKPNVSAYYHTFREILNTKIIRLDSFVGSSTVKRCARYFQSNYAEKNELMIACLHEIMVLLKAAKSPKQAFDSNIDINNMRSYVIDDYFVNKFRHGSLVKLAELLEISPQHTQRIIKKMYNQSFSERITQMKMHYAKSLLTDTDLSIAQISEKCGYSGTNGFFVAFKKFFGKTPNELRKKAEE